jgi:hypothetical protein
MVGLLRVAFVNTSKNTSVTIQIETQDSVECCELLTTTPSTSPEQNPGTTHPPGVWGLDVAPGTMFGFVTEHPVNIINSNPAAVATIYADGKDPWPHPPPPTTLASVADFDTRYNSFLMTSALPNPKPKTIVMRLAPAHRTP